MRALTEAKRQHSVPRKAPLEQLLSSKRPRCSATCRKPRTSSSFVHVSAHGQLFHRQPAARHPKLAATHLCTTAWC